MPLAAVGDRARARAREPSSPSRSVASSPTLTLPACAHEDGAGRRPRVPAGSTVFKATVGGGPPRDRNQAEVALEAIGESVAEVFEGGEAVEGRTGSPLPLSLV